MKKIMTVMLMAVTVYLHNGAIHHFQNAGVYESPEYSYTHQMGWTLWTKGAKWDNYLEEERVAGLQVEDKAQYLVVFDKGSNKALAIYQTSDIKSIQD